MRPGAVTAAVVTLAVAALVTVAPVALAAEGVLDWALAPAGFAVVTASALTLRARSTARQAERDRLAHEQALAAGRARVRAAQVRAGQRRTAADVAAEAAARAAFREAADLAAMPRRRAAG